MELLTSPNVHRPLRGPVYIEEWENWGICNTLVDCGLLLHDGHGIVLFLGDEALLSGSAKGVGPHQDDVHDVSHDEGEDVAVGGDVLDEVGGHAGAGLVGQMGRMKEQSQAMIALQFQPLE